MGPDGSGARRLVGTWRLEAAEFEVVGAERFNIYGEHPVGRLILTRDGWMAAILMAADRDPEAGPASLFASMMAYSGRYRIEAGDRFITSVDLAWSPTWAGTDQVRFFKIEGDTLSITTEPQHHPRVPDQLGRGMLTWRRER